jgi:hypothetical protein
MRRVPQDVHQQVQATGPLHRPHRTQAFPVRSLRQDIPLQRPAQDPQEGAPGREELRVRRVPEVLLQEQRSHPPQDHPHGGEALSGKRKKLRDKLIHMFYPVPYVQ